VKYRYTIKHAGRVKEITAVESINQFLIDLPYSECLIDKMDECPICFVPFTEDEVVSEFQCPKLHIYHRECITTWLSSPNSTKSCPYCR
jgi:hypothetical protein